MFTAKIYLGARARTLEAGERWARLAQARASSRPGLCATAPGRSLDARGWQRPFVLCLHPQPTGLPSKRGPGLGSFSRADRGIGGVRQVHEIKRRLLLERKAMTNLDSIFKSRDITLPTKFRLVKAMVFPVVMYGCESWTVKKAERQRIDAFYKSEFGNKEFMV